jgi:hypothetical protein
MMSATVHGEMSGAVGIGIITIIIITTAATTATTTTTTTTIIIIIIQKRFRSSHYGSCFLIT